MQQSLFNRRCSKYYSEKPNWHRAASDNKKYITHVKHCYWHFEVNPTRNIHSKSISDSMKQLKVFRSSRNQSILLFDFKCNLGHIQFGFKCFSLKFIFLDIWNELIELILDRSWCFLIKLKSNINLSITIRQERSAKI